MKNKIIIAISILIFVAIGTGLFFYLNDGKDTPNNEKKVEVVTIKFDADNGNVIEDIKLDKNSTTELPIPEKKDYKFLGWYIGEEKIENGYKFSKDCTLTAKWEKVETNTKPETKPNTTKPETKSSTTKSGTKPVTYKCPNGYNLNATKCTKKITKNATLVSETCPAGYNKNPSLGKCVADKYSSTATPTCPNDYTKRPGYSYCYQYVQPGLDKYTCENYSSAYVNGKYTNGSCYYGKSVELTYKCPSGYHLRKIWGYSGPVDESYKCHQLKDFIKKYSCESGYTLSGTTCTKTETINATKK